jgi:hypothetical protein
MPSGMIKNAPPVKHDKDSLQKDEQDKPSPPDMLTIPKRRRRGRCMAFLQNLEANCDVGLWWGEKPVSNNVTPYNLCRPVTAKGSIVNAHGVLQPAPQRSQTFPADDPAYLPQSLGTASPTVTGTCTNKTKLSPLWFYCGFDICPFVMTL